MRNELTKRNQVTDSVYLLPAFIFSLSILLVRLHLFSMPLTDIYWSEATDTTTLSDLFNYWKCLAILAAGGLACIMIIAGYFSGQICFKKSFFYIPALIYVVFVLLSLLFSDYKYFAVRGMQEHFEGTFVLLAYITMIIFLTNIVDSKRRVKIVVSCTLFGVLLINILGFGQAIKEDFFFTAAGQKAMTPHNFILPDGTLAWDRIDELMSTTGQHFYGFSFVNGEVYQTVYNINYVVLYLAAILPVAATIYMYNSTKKDDRNIIPTIFALLFYALLLYNFFAANSSSGYVGLLVIFLMALFVFHRNLREWSKQIICFVLVSAIIMGVLSNRWLPEIKDLISTTLNTTTSKVYADDMPDLNTSYSNAAGSVYADIDFIETKNDILLFSIGGNVLKIVRDNENSAFVIADSEDNQLYLRKLENEDGDFELLDDRFHDFLRLSLVNYEGMSTIEITTNGEDKWYFPYTIEDGFVYRNKVGKNVSLAPVPHANLIKDYTFGSNRGRIWDTTIPMLSKFTLVGAGADTYCFVYPQNDYATLYNTKSDLNLVTDKAHNLYLQYWVNTGLISLLAWLTMVGYYLVGAVKQFRKRGFVDFCDFVNGGIFCGICGFLVVAFFNDGSVNTMPMFYTMLGTGLAINMRNKWPSDEPVGETSGSDGADPGEGKKKGKKAKAAAEVMPEM